MNYVNKDNAIALKELGFDVPVPGYHNYRGVLIHGEPENTNAEFESFVSAPDFLTAADWLASKYGVRLEFHVLGTVFRNKTKAFTEGDHRNAAISFAIEQIKQRQNEIQH